MNLLKKHINKAFTFVTGVITIDSYKRLLENDNVIKQTNDLLVETMRKSTEIADRLEEVLLVNNRNKVEVETKLNLLRDNLDNVVENSTKLSTALPKNQVTDIINTDIIIDKSKDLTESVNKTSTILDEIIKLISDPTSSYSNLSINEIYTQYINFLSTLTTTQVGAIAYTIVSVFLIYLLINILLIFYGDKLIDHFNIEDKYPKLGKFINLRRKFQDFYIVSNTLLGIFLLLYLLYINLLIIYHIF
jgi:hypothetical protein